MELYSVDTPFTDDPQILKSFESKENQIIQKNDENGQNFNFNDFRNFNQSDFQGFANTPRFDEVAKAKEFFGFTQTPTKEEIKKRYKELAKKYHPDINDGNDENMKQLNHYRDVLQKIAQ